MKKTRTAVLAALLVLTVVPAAPGLAATAACPATIPSGGFTDVAGLSVEAIESINCIRFYGITSGTTATTFSPNSNVLRYEVALFLTRTLTVDGVALPNGSNQGFTDLGGLSSAAVTAINQLKQLGISTGTAPTTFSPNNPVLRYEMALFLTRMLIVDGVSLPNGANQGFTDIGGLSLSAQTAVNQLRQLGITAGTTATTYTPNGVLPRWQMALFLARSLSVMGVVAGVGVFTVTPTGSATLTGVAPAGVDSNTSDDRGYTASSLLSGTHKITLFPAANVTVSGSTITFADVDDNSVADGLGSVGARIVNVNGAVVVATNLASGAPVVGNITFIVDGDGLNTEAVVPVVWFDSDNDSQIDLNSSNRPTEALGVGGSITYSSAEANGGPFGPGLVVTSVNEAGDVFVAGGRSYFWDSNDNFQIGGGSTSRANFEDQISSDDTIGGNYADSSGATSTFNLADVNPVAPTLGALTVGTNQITVNWSQAAGDDTDGFSIYRALSANNTDCSGSESYTKINSGLDNASPYVDNTVGVPEQYCYQVSATNDGDEGPRSGEGFVQTATVDAGAPTIVDARVGTDAGLVGLLDGGDVHKFAFSEAMNGTIDDAASFYRLSDVDGTIVDLTCNAGCSRNGGDEVVGGVTYGANRVLTVDTSAGATITPVAPGGTAGLQYAPTTLVTNVSSQWDDLAGNQLDLAGSPDKTLS